MAAGGQVMIGTMKPLHGVAVAHDGKHTLAMLRRRSEESLTDLLARLDAAIVAAQASGNCVDEINLAFVLGALRASLKTAGG
jgi:hypothetical protein